MNLLQALKTAIDSQSSVSIYAKIDPQANAFTFDSEACFDESDREGWMFSCDSLYAREYLESVCFGMPQQESLDRLLDEINEVEFPVINYPTA